MNVNRGMMSSSSTTSSADHNVSTNINPFPHTFQNHGSQDAPFFNGLDASSSKQLAALTAAANARRAQAQAAAAGPTSASFVGGINPSQLQFRPDQPQSFPHTANANHQTPFPPPASLPLSGPSAMQSSMGPQANQFPQRPQLTPQQVVAINKNRRMSFFQGLSKIMAARNMPLPSSITGIESAYEPATSPWRDLESASEPGGIRLAGKDVDLYRLWGTVYQAGGAGKVQQQNGWPAIAMHLDLPQQLPHPQENGNTSTAVALGQIYTKLLGAFEEFYQRGMGISDTQKQALAQQGRLPILASASFHGHGNSMSPPGSSGGPTQSQQPTVADLATDPSSGPVASENDADAETRKRKMDEGASNDEETNGKRRQTDPESSELSVSRRNLSRNIKANGSPPSTTHPVSISQIQMSASSAPPTHTKARRKIEYVPLAREIETAGGRSISDIQIELQRLSRGQQLRDINDWGKVYVEALTMSLRSRLSVELSYGLTTLILLSTMRSQGHDTGFLITQCSELLDEVLDLLEDLAFPNGTEVAIRACSEEIVTNRRLVGYAHDESTAPFACGEKRQGDYNPAEDGPMQRRGDLIRVILNILRNLSAVTDNQSFMAEHPALVDLLLLLTPVRRSEGVPAPVSDAFSLPDLIAIRKDVLNILVNIGGAVVLSAPQSQSEPSRYQADYDRRARLIFQLISSYLVDPAEAVSPFVWVIQSGLPMAPPIRAPLLPDAALEVFSRVSQPDATRRAISRAVPQHQQWSLFEALVHRLPCSDNDYKLIVAREESWMSSLEKTVLSLYSLAFLMAPELKKRVREDRTLCFAKVMLRFVKRVMNGGVGQAEVRMHFSHCTRRAIETMKVIDDGEDSFDVAQPSMPSLSFGVGYGEVGEQKVKRGDGLLGGHEDEVLWTIMMQREMDDIMFSELESLTRVEREVRVY